MTSPAKKTEIPMMVGTSGKKDYMAFAKKDGMALGIKPEQIVGGVRFGVPGSTWFGARLRSAKDAGVFTEPEQTSNVVKFGKTPEKPGDAWPAVTWEKNDTNRASTVIGVLLKGGPESPESAKVLVSQIQDKQLATKMVDYLETIAGKENFVLDREAAIEWFDKQYQLVVDQLTKMIAVTENMTEEMKSTIGHFNMHADVLKKVYDKTKDQIEDEPEDEDEDEEDDDEGYSSDDDGDAPHSA